MGQDLNILTQCNAANIMSLRLVFKEGAGSGFLQLRDIVTSNKHVVHSTTNFRKLSEPRGSDNRKVKGYEVLPFLNHLSRIGEL